MHSPGLDPLANMLLPGVPHLPESETKAGRICRSEILSLRVAGVLGLRGKEKRK